MSVCISAYKLILALVFRALLPRPRLTIEQKACIFRKPVVIGASISASTALVTPFYQSYAQALAIKKGIFRIGDFGPSPTRFLLSGYSNNGFFSGAETDYSVKFTRSKDDLGSAQIRRLVQEEHSVLSSASVVIGIDAFYWDAIVGNCGDRHNSVETSIKWLIGEARLRNIKLILGNLPYEYEDKVLIGAENAGIFRQWKKPVRSCVDSVNQLLTNLCLPQFGCYLVDTKGPSERLNNGELLTLRDGSSYGLYAMRPDGVHLSREGSLYYTERIVDALEANPPKCH